MLRKYSTQNYSKPSSLEGAALPEENVLKRIAEFILKQDSNGSSVTVSDVNDISARPHTSMRNATLINFGVVSDPKNVSQEQFSVLMKSGDDSSSSTEVQAYSTLFKDLHLGGSGSSSKLNIFQVAPFQQGTFYNLIPRPYLIQKPHLFLEDLESPMTGFKNLFSDQGTVDPFNLDFSHCFLAIETLARFHACSYLLRRHLGEKGKGKLELLRKYPFLSQQSHPVFSSRQSPALSPIFEKGFELTCKLIESHNPSLAFKLQRKVDPSQIFEKIVKLLEEEKYENDDFYVVCHGSLLAENLLFANKGEEPSECRLINLSSLLVAPLTSDLALFLLTSTSLSFRQEYEEKLLALYCDAFQEQVISSARSFGGSPSDLIAEFEENIDEFHRKVEKQYRKMLEFGFYLASVLLPLMSYRKETLSSNNNGYQWRCSSISDLLKEFGHLFADSDMQEFENFVMNDQFLGERLVEIVKQLVKCRVLI